MRIFFTILAALVFPFSTYCGNAGARAVKAVPVYNFTFDCKVSKPSGIFKKGEEIVLSGRMLEKGTVPRNRFVCAQLLFNEKVRETRILPAAQEAVFRTSSDKAGWFMLRLTVLDEKKKTIINPASPWKAPFRGGVGAMVAPEEIRPGMAEPADFDEFWKKQRAELDKVPLKAVRTPVAVGKRYEGKVLCWDVKVECAGGMPVSGYLCMPVGAKPGSLPALVSYHGAGVRSAYKPLNDGQNMISFNVNAHGIENGKSADFYHSLNKNELKAYPHRNKNNRELFYFRGMFLRIMRSLDYVKSLPEWNGKILIVTGGSQGGAQALVAAALEPRVTFCGSNVPALCDHGGSLAERTPGWPRLYRAKPGSSAHEKVADAVKYYDVCYFARRIKCETRICTGFIDSTCAPTSVYAAYNSIPETTPKAIFTNPIGTHGMKHEGLQERIKKIIADGK